MYVFFKLARTRFLLVRLFQEFISQGLNISAPPLALSWAGMSVSLGLSSSEFGKAIIGDATTLDGQGLLMRKSDGERATVTCRN